MKTIIVNKFDKSFGPVGSQAGIAIFIAGIALTFFNLVYVLLMLFGAFVAFTNNSVLDVTGGASAVGLADGVGTIGPTMLLLRVGRPPRSLLASRGGSFFTVGYYPIGVNLKIGQQRVQFGDKWTDVSDVCL